MSITKPRGQSVTGGDEKVLSDVAAGAGLLLRNISLNAELTERANQLRASRRRLVEAHDAERHRLERNLHDGAQQQVVALKVKLGIARTLAGREGAERVAQIVESLAEDTQIAVEEMRAVAPRYLPAAARIGRSCCRAGGSCSIANVAGRRRYGGGGQARSKPGGNRLLLRSRDRQPGRGCRCETHISEPGRPSRKGCIGGSLRCLDR